MEKLMPKIFISHASLDAPIGERFLEALVELGINKDNVFYSSSYHTGVKIGENFHEEVKRAINSTEIVIFLLTSNFYKSEFCLNEMGAAWVANKRILPILLNNLTYNDMKGFIDSHYIVFKPNEDDAYKLFEPLKHYIEKPNYIKGIKEIFLDFINEANKIAEKTTEFSTGNQEISNLEEMIISNKFTDEEILLLNYFEENRINQINDNEIYNYGTQKYEESEDLLKIKEYSKKYDFDYQKAKRTLEKSGYITCEYDFYNGNEEYVGCELDIDLFRDLISMSKYGKEVIENVKVKYERVVSIPDSQTKKISENKIEQLIRSDNFKEIEALLFNYILDTYSFTLGDRWMANIEIEKIRLWESEKCLDSKLSRNYDTALRIIIYQGLVEVVSTTSYGNPKEYKMKDEYIEQLTNLNIESKNILDSVLKSNTFELPF